MQRVTISIDEGLGEEFDTLISEQGYTSRSEAVRDLVRNAVENRRLEELPDGACVACLSYVYDHATRDLAQRLVDLQHDHHDVIVTTTHVHLDHDACLESTILRGQTAAVRGLADRIQAERGVRFANLNLISARPNDEHHHGVASDHSHAHAAHFSPRRG